MLKRQTVQMLWVKVKHVGSKRQTVQMLWVKDVSKTNSTNVMCKTCLKDKQCKCCK